MPKFGYTTDLVRIMNKTVSNYRHSRLALLVLFCSIYPVLLSTTVSAAESAHKVLPVNSNNCLKEIGSQLRIEGTTFIMGDDYTYREEGPAHEVTLSSFWMDAHEVTNGQFAEFVADTGYVTVAERQPNPEDWPGVPVESLEPGSTLFTSPQDSNASSNWWSYVGGVSWRHPEGPKSSIQGKDNYPVVHVAWEDAQAYATWAGRELPTEAQFELVALSKRNSTFPWEGEELAPDGHHHANTWQGNFPIENTGEDEHVGIAPVGCFKPNDFGVYDLIGNVWEWTTNWYAPGHNPSDNSNPDGPAEDQSFDYANAGFPVKVIKGGSYLCAPNYCMRYRPAARQAADTGLGTSHIGFRTVKAIK